jgi:hypothetical protein
MGVEPIISQGIHLNDIPFYSSATEKYDSNVTYINAPYYTTFPRIILTSSTTPLTIVEIFVHKFRYCCILLLLVKPGTSGGFLYIAYLRNYIIDIIILLESYTYD